jgi:hypothetical protein
MKSIYLGITETQPIQQLDEIRDVLLTHCQFAVNAEQRTRV